MQSLKCLYLHENRIEEISVRKRFKFLSVPWFYTLLKGLSNLVALSNLNLSNNYITRLCQLAELPNLHTLNIAKWGKRKPKICARDTFQQPTANGGRCERTFQLQISLRARPLTQPPWGSRGKIQIIGSKKVKFPDNSNTNVTLCMTKGPNHSTGYQQLALWLITNYS